MRKAPRGFTLVELLTVIVLMTSLAMFSMPKFTGLRERSNLTSAREHIEGAIVTARSTAMQKGTSARVVFSGNKVFVTATTTSGTTLTVLPAVPLDSTYGVTVSASDTAVAFDARGFASPRLAAPGMIRLLGATRRDSICITVIGQLMPRGCQL